MTRGLRSDGIRTWDDLRDRCKIDDDTLCWIWQGGRQSNGQPSMWIPALRKSSVMSVLVAYLKTGQPPVKGRVWYARCGRPDCCNPQHRSLGTKSDQMRALKLVRDPLLKARISRTKLAQGKCKVPAEDLARIQAERPLLSEIMAQYGVSQSYASVLRNGKAGPRQAAARMSSVWALGVGREPRSGGGR